jgi:hypothetical protein
VRTPPSEGAVGAVPQVKMSKNEHFLQRWRSVKCRGGEICTCNVPVGAYEKSDRSRFGQVGRVLQKETKVTKRWGEYESVRAWNAPALQIGGAAYSSSRLHPPTCH